MTTKLTDAQLLMLSALRKLIERRIKAAAAAPEVASTAFWPGAPFRGLDA
jgi:hypothetical protein